MAVRLVKSVVLGGALLLAPASAMAQGAPLSQMLVDLIQSDIRLDAPPPGFPSHEAHFIPGTDQQLAPYLFNQQLVTRLATVPTGSSSGGFSFTFDPALGVFQRATNTFGPSFAERALTNGRGKLTVGGNWQYSKYTSFNGTDLDSGDITFYLRHAAAGGSFFEGDLIQTDLSLEVSSSTTTLFANYGLNDKWDLAVTLPIISVDMSARVDATVLRLASGANSPIHTFPNGSTTDVFERSGSQTGVGDLLLRSKYRFHDMAGGGLAIGADLRLPTGDDENLLGTGAPAFAAQFIGSSANGRWSPHVNVGFLVSGDGDVVNTPNEFTYTGGVEFEAAPTVTLSADLVGRTLFDVGKLELVDTTWNYRNGAGDPGSVTLTEYDRVDGAVNLLTFAVGGKFNVAGNVLITGNLLFSLSDTGLTAPVTPVIGVDLSF